MDDVKAVEVAANKFLVFVFGDREKPSGAIPIRAGADVRREELTYARRSGYGMLRARHREYELPVVVGVITAAVARVGENLAGIGDHQLPVCVVAASESQRSDVRDAIGTSLAITDVAEGLQAIREHAYLNHCVRGKYGQEIGGDDTDATHDTAHEAVAEAGESRGYGMPYAAIASA